MNAEKHKKTEPELSPRYMEFKKEAMAYLESINDLPVDEVIKKELHTILPGLFKKHFPHKIRDSRDLEGVFTLNFDNDKPQITFDKAFMDDLKYDRSLG